MKHYFLLDFENVSDAGLAGFFDLTPSDTVYLFYTQKSNRISIDFATALLERTDHAEVRFIKVASGNQALDLQLASFLGSLIAGRKEECDYWIISRDKGFACLSSFWTNQSGLARLTQAASIQDALSAGNGNHTESAQIPPAPCRPAAPKNGDKAAASAAPKNGDKTAASAAAEPVQEPAKPAAEAAQSNGKALAAQPQSEKSILNTKVQQTLSKAKYDTKIIAHAASAVSKCYGDTKIKQLIYRDFIKQYGQKQGLELYNLVKPLL